MDTRYKASLFATGTALVLALSKFSVGFISGSMAVISSGLDSLLDVFMSGMNLYAIKRASMPADSSHQYGHGKIEDFAALVESMIITGVGVVIIYKAILGLLHNTHVHYTRLDIPIMIISLAFSFIISYVLKTTSEKTGSVALKADALHYTSDVYSNSGAVLAIALTYFTGYNYFDFAFALIIGIIVITSSVRVLMIGVSGLMDKSISESTLKDIKDIIENMPYPYAGFHKLRTRTSGSRKYIDFHLLLCRRSSIKEAHEMAERIEDKIKGQTPSIDTTIHLEPCDKACDLTDATCAIKKSGETKT